MLVSVHLGLVEHGQTHRRVLLHEDGASSQSLGSNSYFPITIPGILVVKSSHRTLLHPAMSAVIDSRAERVHNPVKSKPYPRQQLSSSVRLHRQRDFISMVCQTSSPTDLEAGACS